MERLVLVHGSAADRSTWALQLASSALRARFELDAFDRSVLDTVEAHADALAARIGDAPAWCAGSSFGAVVVLDCARRHPDRVRAAILCEPPLPASDAAPAVPDGFLEALDARAAEAGGPAAVELFLRNVLGDATYDRLPAALRTRLTATWPALRADCGALAAYRVGYDRLGGVTAPVLLVGGDRSPPYFGPTLDALAAALPRATRITLQGGHMMHAEDPRGFERALLSTAWVAGS